MPRSLKRSGLIWQAALVAGLAVVAILAAHNVAANLDRAGISLSFDILNSRAGFDISESLIPVSSDSTYGAVFLAGIVNTIVLSLTCIAGATVIGVIMGVLRTSGHFLGEKVAAVYVELMRNLPKLLILLALLLVVINTLPPVRQAWSVLGMVFISNRAIYFPLLAQSSGLYLLLALAVLWPLGLLIGSRIADNVQARTGVRHPVFVPVTAAAVIIPAVAAMFGLVRFPLEVPALSGFDFREGGRLSIQFAVLALALSIYHGGQVAELVRGAIEAVPRGQFEAARAAGLRFIPMMRLVVLPQAVRVALPSMGNQYLNITKNTSIGLAVGYSDLVSVMTTSINQTFRPIELMTVSMSVYLVICLAVSLAVNAYNARVNRVGV